MLEEEEERRVDWSRCQLLVESMLVLNRQGLPVWPQSRTERADPLEEQQPLVRACKETMERQGRAEGFVTGFLKRTRLGGHERSNQVIAVGKRDADRQTDKQTDGREIDRGRRGIWGRGDSVDRLWAGFIDRLTDKAHGEAGREGVRQGSISPPLSLPVPGVPPFLPPSTASEVGRDREEVVLLLAAAAELYLR